MSDFCGEDPRIGNAECEPEGETENFFDAVRNDPTMTDEQKTYWLSKESGLTPGGEMKRTKRAEIIKTEHKCYSYHVICPHCHTELDVTGQHVMLGVKVMTCFHCKNLIDLCPKETK